MVIKNPAVSPGSPYLAGIRRIETDISLFLAASPARLCAVTGSKGKSGTASAIHWGLREAREGEEKREALLPGRARLGGNITVSPLGFLDEDLQDDDDVVLELSSWQLGDLRGRLNGEGCPLLKPRAAVLTAILPDHLDRYPSMEAYVADKRVIYQGQDSRDATVAGSDIWGLSFRNESKGRPLVYTDSPLPEGVAGGWVSGPSFPAFARLYRGIVGGVDGAVLEVVPETILTPGSHQKKNLLAAALALLDLGLPPDFIRESLGRFPGIEHRLEFFYESGGLRFYNDSAATIPEAAAAALAAFEKPPILICGGTDKNLDFRPLALAAAKAKTLILLSGTGSVKLKALLEDGGIGFKGPFDSLEAALCAALEAAERGDTVLLSPGCTSFGMFLNEFDRGAKWKETARRLA
jgi:UDP-N-acetylmuramoylalanine--D-glutamate ligase